MFEWKGGRSRRARTVVGRKTRLTDVFHQLSGLKLTSLHTVHTERQAGGWNRTECAETEGQISIHWLSDRDDAKVKQEKHSTQQMTPCHVYPAKDTKPFILVSSSFTHRNLF